jgi:hypothetical protein
MGVSGQPGQPGEPGEPGVHGGGRGGHGGAGGRGGSASREKWLEALCLIAFLIAGVMSAYAIHVASVADHDAQRITRLERVDVADLHHADDQHERSVQLIRQTDYRLCLRGQVTRAAINSDKDHDEPRLALYDCSPDLRGGVAVRLTAAQAAAFERQVARRGYAP